MIASPLDPLVGQTLAGRYRIVRQLGQGGMGAIYLAIQEPLGREVALKVLLTSVTHDGTAALRFEQEARAVSRLRHPHIVTLYDFGRTEDGRLFITMEFLDGVSLRELVSSETRLSYRRALHIVRGLTSGLAEAHRQGIMHRDLKPENAMVVEQADDPDFVKILDFGLARSVEMSQDSRLTQQNTIPGTPAYLPPERAAGVDDDLRSDLYSLGALWFELLCGRPPFEDENPLKVVVRHMQEPAPSPRGAGADSDLPPHVEALILRLLEKQPERRPDSAAALLVELTRLETSESWSVASTTQVASRVTQLLPSLQALADAEESLEELEFSSLDDPAEEPIALTHRKELTGGTEPPSDTNEAAVVLLTRLKVPPKPSHPLTSIAEAATRLSSARGVLDVAETMVAYLRSRFDRAAVIDLRLPPSRVLAAFGLPAEAGLLDAIRANEELWQLAERGEAYYGPPRPAAAWLAFHRTLGELPGGVLIAALQRDGAPALLVYADHRRPELYEDLNDAATLLREAAAALTGLGF